MGENDKVLIVRKYFYKHLHKHSGPHPYEVTGKNSMNAQEHAGGKNLKKRFEDQKKADRIYKAASMNKNGVTAALFFCPARTKFVTFSLFSKLA